MGRHSKKMLSKAVHFAGATGFPCKVYAPILHQLQKDLGSSHKITSSDYCHHMAKDIIDWEDAVDGMAEDIRKLQQPIIGVGHSGGGTVMAATFVKYPELFHDIVIYDPALFRWSTRIERRDLLPPSPHHHPCD